MTQPFLHLLPVRIKEEEGRQRAAAWFCHARAQNMPSSGIRTTTAAKLNELLLLQRSTEAPQ